MRWFPDESAAAGAEHLDAAYAAAYDLKADFDVEPDLELLCGLGVGSTSTVIDFGAGTGRFAAAAASHCGRVIAVDPSPPMLAVAQARGVSMECVQAGFLSYEHTGEAPDVVYSRNALHHLPDAWKAVALRRVAELLKSGGALVLRDIVYCCDSGELQEVLEAWLDSAPDDSAHGWTRVELEAHVRDEFSTFTWLLEPMLRQAGFEIRDAWYSCSRTYARYVCVKS